MHFILQKHVNLNWGVSYIWVLIPYLDPNRRKRSKTLKNETKNQGQNFDLSGEEILEKMPHNGLTIEADGGMIQIKDEMITLHFIKNGFPSYFKVPVLHLRKALESTSIHDHQNAL